MFLKWVTGIVVSFGMFSLMFQYQNQPSFSNFAKRTPEQTEPRIIAVGDLHGDYSQAVKTLQMAHVIDSEKKWSAGDTYFVQTGDIFDRGDDTISIFSMIGRLMGEASAVGGNLIQLLGNHEIMNLAEDYRYVTWNDIDSFGGLQKRKKMFSTKGIVGRSLRRTRIAYELNGNVFFHAGASPEWATLGIQGLNNEGIRRMVGKNATEIDDAPIFFADGPVWYRGYGLEDDIEVCGPLYIALRKLNAKRMVIGHNVQFDGKIKSKCNGRLFIIDTGIASYYGGHSSALEIIGDRVFAIYPDRRVELPSASTYIQPSSNPRDPPK